MFIVLYMTVGYADLLGFLNLQWWSVGCEEGGGRKGGWKGVCRLGKWTCNSMETVKLFRFFKLLLLMSVPKLVKYMYLNV